jgi:anaerobic selenocysteine-containing dehydrogenase/Fe-S-cluster-containing hydrogenase component 2
MLKKQKRYGMFIDLHRCIGCYACQVTCKAEYDIPFGTFRCRVHTHSTGRFPEIKKLFLPRLCNHCDNAPCIDACEENALLKNQDGVVVINNEKCTDCRMCYEKCPYGAIEASQYTGKTEKCDFCYTRRITKGLLPVCVESCMGRAITFGDINDKSSAISEILKKNHHKVLYPELGTNPSVFYGFKGDTSYTPLKGWTKTVDNPTARIYTAKPDTSRSHTAKIIHTSDAMCPSECGISVLVEGGTAKKIYGNPRSLINNGAFCAKGASGLQLTYSPYRIKTPLMRAGRRGEEKWKKITWQEAADYISKILIRIKQKHGPEAVFFDGGDVTDREAYYRLFHAFGSPHTYNHGSICDPNRRWGQGIMTGDERPLPDIQRPFLTRDRTSGTCLNRRHDAKLIMNIGSNPFVATRFNYMSSGIPAAQQENGCKYIVVDPSHTNSASHADIWLTIRPGTDAALLAAMLLFIIENDSPGSPSKKYIDHTFLKEYTVGWEEFKDTFLFHAGTIDPSNKLRYFSYEWAEEKTGIPENDIKKVSHLFGITKPASIEIGMHGTSHHTNGDVTSILMTALCLVTGNMDKPGGLVFTDSQKAKKGGKTVGKEFLEKTVTRTINGHKHSGRLRELHKDLFGDYPAAWRGVLSDLPGRIKQGVSLKHGPFRGYSYPVKAFITRAGNPVITAGSTPDWIEAITAKDEHGDYLLDLMVFIDTHITVSGKYADIILPEAGFLERMGLSDVFTMSPEIAIRDQVIQPLYESKTPFEIMAFLSDALVKNGDPDIRVEDFSGRYRDEEDFIDELLSETPGFYNIGTPLPYPDIPEGALIKGTPDNPTAVIEDNVVKQGERLTVDWLRRNHGVAVWPAGYERYKKSDGTPSMIYPNTGSKKFEFRFSFLEDLNNKLGTCFPVTFYWSECKWNPGNSEYQDIINEFPFQLISGRVHSAMTMTTVCPYLAETETECLKPLNNSFRYRTSETQDILYKYGFPGGREISFNENSVSIPVFSFNHNDGSRLGLKTGDAVILENPLGKSIKGKVYLTEEIMPGVIKTAFGPGGQKASGIGFMNNTTGYTPNINELFDPDNLNRFTGMPGFGDIMVKVKKIKS